jgi:hypothetical protein
MVEHQIMLRTRSRRSSEFLRLMQKFKDCEALLR